MSTTFKAGAGSRLAVGLQSNYFNNSSTTIDTLLNITSATFDPSVEKKSEETLLQSKVKTGSLLTSITVDASFDANLRPEMTDWFFKAGLQNATVSSTDSPVTGYILNEYTLEDAGNDPLGSTFVLAKGDTSTKFTYPGMTVRSFSMTMPNNDFVTVSADLVGREEIRGAASSSIPANAKPSTTYVSKYSADIGALEYTKASYIVTRGVFEWQEDPSSETTNVWCIESATLTVDNGIDDSPRCYQDGLFANIPVMGMRAITLDLNLPYDSKIDTLKDRYLFSSATGKATIEFTNADDQYEKIIVTIPNLSITTVGSGISGTGVIEATVSGEAIQSGNDEPIIIQVQTKE